MHGFRHWTAIGYVSNEYVGNLIALVVGSLFYSSSLRGVVDVDDHAAACALAARVVYYGFIGVKDRRKTSFAIYTA